MLAVGPASAGEAFSGRWTSDPAACADAGLVTGPFVVTPLTLRWPDTTCSIRTSYRVGDVWHVSARCPDAATDVAVALQMRGDRLVLTWSGRPVELRRCP